MKYAASKHALVFKVHSKSFMDRGIDIAWCSAFPDEREFLYPPLTYMQPTTAGLRKSPRREEVAVGQVKVAIFEVEPRFGT